MNSRTERRLGIAAAAALTVAALIAPALADRSPHRTEFSQAHDMAMVQFAYADQGNKGIRE
ncbi:hypothetical protein GCM10011491_15590 [Brucella endophytica]|uniref:Uncharacterized protein n=1 Tax=Brucella endophytica TaxID=1963359 RepID=A0A916S8B9_9HYPH|nr:hypothetical protein [Brucella endophytica]GGA88676.1 hypothetical protein GCM10011491_15590 [Brucella endophytica]